MISTKEIWETYKEYLREIRWKFKPKFWVGLSVGAGIAGMALVWGIEFLGILPADPVAPFLALVVILDVMIGIPYLNATRRIEEIERVLPDAFKQMSDTLKAGGTFEYALRGISTSQYGALTVEMNAVLRRLEEGENLQNSMQSFAKNVKSRIIKRSVNIVLDSIAAGASLADILDEIADDVRASHRIKQERRSSTVMQVLFMIGAGSVVAPFILGLVSTVITFLIKTSGGVIMTAAEFARSMAKADFILTLLRSYLIIAAVATGGMISLIREGNVTKSIIYIPILVLIAYTVYYGSFIVSQGFFGG